MPGVRITVLDHPEYGETLTREDGQFDVAVNGGGTVTLVYEKDRYMTTQRQVEAPWRDFATIEDVVLVGYSRRVTDVDLAGTDEMLVARGSPITDVDGTRQSTVLFPGDTQAEMVMPDGTTQLLPQIDSRATEYTVGEGGPKAMPAPLPPTSDYTYSLGRIVEKTESVGGESTTYSYSYDAEGNLEEVRQDGGLVASYAYDENGNRLSHTTPSGTTEGTYDAQDRLTSYGDNDYAYTPDGHLKSKTDRATGETTSYAYDALGNLLSATLPDGKKVEYVMDAADRRVGKKVNGQLVQGFLYQGSSRPRPNWTGQAISCPGLSTPPSLTFPTTWRRTGRPTASSLIT